MMKINAQKIFSAHSRFVWEKENEPICMEHHTIIKFFIEILI